MKETRPKASQAALSPDERRARIAAAAYLRAEARHFAPGHADADWLAAEAAVDRELTQSIAPKRTAVAKPKTTKPKSAKPKTAKPKTAKPKSAE